MLLKFNCKIKIPKKIVFEPNRGNRKKNECRKKTLENSSLKITYSKNAIFYFLGHCMKSVQIRIFSGPYFPVCGLNTD